MFPAPRLSRSIFNSIRDLNSEASLAARLMMTMWLVEYDGVCPCPVCHSVLELTIHSVLHDVLVGDCGNEVGHVGMKTA